IANSNNAAFELNTGNNSSTSTAFPVHLTPYADLQVASVTVPPQVTAGQPVTISWIVTDAGPGATNAAGWDATGYLSSTPTLNLSTAIALGSVQNPSYLGPGDQYASSLTATVPSTLSGPFFAIVVTDSGNAQYEFQFENNNTTASATTIQVQPAPAPGFL